MANTKGWGGVRANSGRKKSADTKKSVVIRVDEDLVPIIKIIKENYQAGQGIDDLIPVINNQKEAVINSSPYQTIDLLQENKELKRKINQLTINCNEEHIKATGSKNQLDKLQKVNLDLVLQRDTANLKVVSLQSKVNFLKANIKGLERSITSLHDKEYNCMALKKDNSRCTRSAKTQITWQGVEIRVCLQHSKMI